MMLCFAAGAPPSAHSGQPPHTPLRLPLTDIASPRPQSPFPARLPVPHWGFSSSLNFPSTPNPAGVSVRRGIFESGSHFYIEKLAGEIRTGCLCCWREDSVLQKRLFHGIPKMEHPVSIMLAAVVEILEISVVSVSFWPVQAVLNLKLFGILWFSGTLKAVETLVNFVSF